MESSKKLIRRSIFTFLQNYNYFTTISSLIALPFSLSILLSSSHPIFSSSIINSRLTTLFIAAGFNFDFNILTLKLSQTISSSFFTLPFALTFLLVAKATVIHHLHSSSVLSLFNSLFFTYLCNCLLIIAANATVFSLFFLVSTFVDCSGFLVSAVGAVVYSIVVANALIVCNLALILSAFERSSSGFVAILKAAFLLITTRGTASTALFLALPLNLTLAAIEALFNYRIFFTAPAISMPFEAIFIAYLYSIILVLDTVLACFFYKSCKLDQQIAMPDNCLKHNQQDWDQV